MAEPLTKQENEELAIHIKAIMEACDAINESFPIERLRATMERMRDHASTMSAGSILLGHDGHLQADLATRKAETFQRMIELVESRQGVFEATLELEKHKNGNREIRSLFGL